MIDPLSPLSTANSENELGVALAENQAWLAALEHVPEEPAPGAMPGNGLAPLGIEGAGFFVLGDKGERLFSRTCSFHIAADGRLQDDRGREVLGFCAGDAGKAPSALRVPKADVTAARYSSYEIDEGGVLYGVHRTTGQHRSAPEEQRVEIGRLCVAIFPAPERLAPRDGDVAAATRLSGAPTYLRADAPHVGALRSHPQVPSFEALRENLRALWSRSGRAEIDVAIVASRDALARVALNLVK